MAQEAPDFLGFMGVIYAEMISFIAGRIATADFTAAAL